MDGQTKGQKQVNQTGTVRNPSGTLLEGKEISSREACELLKGHKIVKAEMDMASCRLFMTLDNGVVFAVSLSGDLSYMINCGVVR